MLTNEEARKGYPVRVRAVVTLNDPNRWLMFVQEGTEAIYSSTGPERHSAGAVGDLVEIQGATYSEAGIRRDSLGDAGPGGRGDRRRIRHMRRTPRSCIGDDSVLGSLRTPHAELDAPRARSRTVLPWAI